MSIIDRVRDLTSSVVDQGQRRIETIRNDRRRSQLLHELGESCYAKSKGAATSESEIEIERIIGEINDLDRDDASTPSADEGAIDNSDTSESTTS